MNTVHIKNTTQFTDCIHEVQYKHKCRTKGLQQLSFSAQHKDLVRAVQYSTLVQAVQMTSFVLPRNIYTAKEKMPQIWKKIDHPGATRPQPES